MNARRSTYTRKQVSIILDVSERSLIRWMRQGKGPRFFRDPTDPLQRCLYDRGEVDRLAKQQRRRRGAANRVDLASRETQLDLASLEPSVPGPIAARVLQMLRGSVPIDEICRETGVPPEYVIRLERLRRQFEAERAASVPRHSKPRIVIDDHDPEVVAWGRQLDELREREAATFRETEPNESDEDDRECQRPPESSKRRG